MQRLNTWRPSDEELEGVTEVQADLVPSLDQEAPAATYCDWTRADTKVITCRIATDAYPGVRYETRDEAAAAVTLVHGKILEANYVPGRAFYRVLKQVKAVTP